MVLSVVYYVLQNEFPGIAEYVRNKTRDMVCEASGRSASTESSLPALFALAYDSQNAKPIGDFDDGYVGSTLAAAAFLNILLPAGTSQQCLSLTMQVEFEVDFVFIVSLC